MKREGILLIGGFHKAKFLALSLLQKGYRVTVINNDYHSCQILAEIHSLEVIHGDGTKPYVLEEAGAAGMSIAIAMTPNDEDNLVVSEICKKKFRIRKTVALVGDPKKTDFFYRVGIDSVVCAINAIVGIIEQQAFINEMAMRIPLGQGRVSIVEVYINHCSPVADKKLWEIAIPENAIIGCILRGEESMIPRGDTRILQGDILLVISSVDQEKDVIKRLTGR